MHTKVKPKQINLNALKIENPHYFETVTLRPIFTRNFPFFLSHESDTQVQYALHEMDMQQMLMTLTMMQVLHHVTSQVGSAT